MAANDRAVDAKQERLTRDRGGPGRPPRSVLGATSLNATALALQVAFRAVSLVVLAYSLGPSGQGEVALGYLVSTVGIAIGSLGLDVALMRSSPTVEVRDAARS